MASGRNILFGNDIMNGTSGPSCIIAEAGINHDGNFDKAKALIDVAVKAKCTCVKFQTFNTKKHMSKKSIASSYIVEGSRENETFYELAKRLELSYDEQRELYKYAQKQSIPWISSFFDEESLEFLLELGMPVLKVASGEITNFPLLGKAAKTGIPMIISTGMATLDEIDEVLGYLKGKGAKELCLMHCVSWYPAKIEDMNLKVIDTLFDRYGIPVGLSDHSLGINASLGARARGVKLFEKHYTLSRKDFGPDHAASIEPGELTDMVLGIGEIGQALGSPEKKVIPIELEQRKVHRKSVVAAIPIKKNEIITSKSIVIKRPGFGIQPKDYEKIIGRRVLKDIDEDSIIEWSMISNEKS